MSWGRSDKNRLDGIDASAGWGTRRSHKPGMVTGPHDGAQTDPSGPPSAFRRAVLGCWARAGEMPSASGSARGFLPGRPRSPRHRDVGARRRPRGPRPRRWPAHREPEPGRALPERTARAVLAADPPCPGRAEDRRPRGAERRGGGAARVGAEVARRRAHELSGGAGAARNPAPPALRRGRRRPARRASRRRIPGRDRLGAGRAQPPGHAGQGDRRPARARQGRAPNGLSAPRRPRGRAEGSTRRRPRDPRDSGRGPRRARRLPRQPAPPAATEQNQIAEAHRPGLRSVGSIRRAHGRRRASRRLLLLTARR